MAEGERTVTPRDRRKATRDARADHRHRVLDLKRQRAISVDAPRVLVCNAHGRTDWRGTIHCSECNAVYQMATEAHPLFAPQICVCGVRLVPDKHQEKGGVFSCRAICQRCYDIAIAFGGKYVEQPKAKGTP